MSNARAALKAGLDRGTPNRARPGQTATDRDSGILIPFASRMDKALQRRLKIAAASRGVPMQEALHQAVTAWVENAETTAR